MSAMKIGDWRAKIDAIDTTLLHLLNVRAGFALEVGRLKGESGQPLRVPARELEILERMVQLNPGPLDTTAVETIYQRILDESIRIQVEHGLGSAELATAPVAKNVEKIVRKSAPSKPRKAVSA
jgi:chorismate mutase-like protein